MSYGVYERPEEPLLRDRVETLREWLEIQRFGIVRAHYVVQVFDSDDDDSLTRQETLVLELHEPPDQVAPNPLWLAVSLESPSFDLTGDGRCIWTFANRRAMPAVRAVGSVVWERDPKRPRPQPVEVELIVDRPELSDELLSDLRGHLEALPHVRHAMFIRERLMLDGEEIHSKVALRITGEVGPRGSEKDMQVSEAIFDVLGPHLTAVGMGWSPELPAEADGLVVFERSET